MVSKDKIFERIKNLSEKHNFKFDTLIFDNDTGLKSMISKTDFSKIDILLNEIETEYKDLNIQAIMKKIENLKNNNKNKVMEQLLFFVAGFALGIAIGYNKDKIKSFLDKDKNPQLPLKKSALIFTLKENIDLSKLTNNSSLYSEKDFFEKNLFSIYISDSYNEINQSFASLSKEVIENKQYTMIIYEFDKDLKFENRFEKRPIFTKLCLDLQEIKTNGKYSSVSVTREQFNNLPQNFHEKNRIY